MDWFSVFDKNGNKVGEIRKESDGGAGCLTWLVGIVIIIGIIVLPIQI